MQISSAQCRAGRALLGWNQEELATKARVSRATVADFESNSRWPMRNNVASIRDAMMAAGIEFTNEQGAGVGVRFSQPKLECREAVRFVSHDAYIAMRFAGRSFECIVLREAIEDAVKRDLSNEQEQRAALSEIWHHVLVAAERIAESGNLEDRLVLTTDQLTKSMQ